MHNPTIPPVNATNTINTTATFIHVDVIGLYDDDDVG